jgi:hypothetical protein
MRCEAVLSAETAVFDFLAHCRPGMVLRTRDRREARILAVAPEAGEISGEVQMMGPCVWRADGRYRDAPAGAVGPWDLMPPAPESASQPQQHRESLAAALQNRTGNPGCCD